MLILRRVWRGNWSHLTLAYDAAHQAQMPTLVQAMVGSRVEGGGMSECPDCTKSAAGVWHGFRADCTGCCARATARGPHFHRVRTTGMQDRQYRAQLTQFGLKHEQVKAAAQNDFTMNGGLQP